MLTFFEVLWLCCGIILLTFLLYRLISISEKVVKETKHINSIDDLSAVDRLLFMLFGLMFGGFTITSSFVVGEWLIPGHYSYILTPYFAFIVIIAFSYLGEIVFLKEGGKE